MTRKLFCEISPLTYKISETKEIIIRCAKWAINNSNYAKTYSEKNYL